MEEKENPFKISGTINLGDINILEERNRALDELNALKKNAEEHIMALGQEHQELRDQLHQKELEVLQLSFKAQIDALAKMIEDKSSKQSFSEQLATFQEMAKELGYYQVPSEIYKLAEIIGKVVAKYTSDK